MRPRLTQNAAQRGIDSQVLLGVLELVQNGFQNPNLVSDCIIHMLITFFETCQDSVSDIILC